MDELERAVMVNFRVRCSRLKNKKQLVEIFLKVNKLSDDNLKYDMQAFDYPHILLENCGFWYSDKIKKPKLEDLELIYDNLNQYRNDIDTITLWDNLREKRNIKLKETDFTQLSDCPLTSQEKQEYKKYRQYLRDLPSLYNNSNVIKAKVVDFQSWKKGKI